jgi:enoyl-CoA hydratase
VTSMTSTATDPEVLYAVRDGVGHVTLNRPAARNALTFAMYDRIFEICRSIELPGQVRALIFSGAGGRAFAAGTDIAQFKDFTRPQQALAYEARMDEVLSAIERCPVPTIAAISGACTGGGAAIALACDIRLGAHDMQFGVPIARTLGNCLSCASLSRMNAIIGHGRTMELLMTARLIPADEALRIGLVTCVTTDHATVLSKASAMATTLANHAPLTMRATKEALRRLRTQGVAARDEDLVEMCYMSDDFAEGINAFLSKRPAKWTGR